MLPEHLLESRCSAGRQYTDIETCTTFQANGGKKTGHVNKRNRWNFLDQSREGFFSSTMTATEVGEVLQVI